MIVNAITSFLGKLIEQVMKPVREFLADTLLSTPDVTKHADIKKLWTAMLGITAGIYVLFVTAGGVTVMGYETVQTRYTLQQVVPRLLLGMVAAATSLTVAGKAIGLSNALAHAIMATDLSGAGQGMVERVLPFTLFGAPGVKLYLLVLAIVMVALVLAVLIGFFVRVAVMALLVSCAPLMLACHAHPLTDPVARLWWRGLAGCLIIQIAQSITFVLALKLFFAPGATALGIPKSDQLGTMLAGLALFWVLFKIPGWTLQVVLRGSPAQHPHAPTGVRVLKHMAMYRLMGHYLPGMTLTRGGAGLGRGRGGAGRGGWSPPGRGGGGPGSGRPPAGPGGGTAPGGGQALPHPGPASRSAPRGHRRSGGRSSSSVSPGPGSGRRAGGRSVSVGPDTRPVRTPPRNGPRAAPVTRRASGFHTASRSNGVAHQVLRPGSPAGTSPASARLTKSPARRPPPSPGREPVPPPATPARSSRSTPRLASAVRPPEPARRPRAYPARPAQLRLPLERPRR
ncbi:hypothetical protein [Streptomyces buecherae]|uniref:hypothetical protein n=1 Tax=Streptomyces buecherae TaxID=2763006 RepID=UPI0037B8672F